MVNLTIRIEFRFSLDLLFLLNFLVFFLYRFSSDFRVIFAIFRLGARLFFVR